MKKNNRELKGLAKRGLAIVLCCLCLLATVPVSAMAQETAPTAAQEETPAAGGEQMENPQGGTGEESPQPLTEEIPEGKTVPTTQNVTPITTETTTTPNTETTTTPSTETTTTPSTETTTTPSTETTTTPSTETTTTPNTETVTPPTDDINNKETETDTEEDGEEIPTETNPVDALFEKLMACTTMAEMNDVQKAMTSEEWALAAQFTEEQNYALSVKVNELNGYAVATLETYNYNIEIVQGDEKYQSIEGTMRKEGFTSSCTLGADITAEFNEVYDGYGYGYGYNILVGANVDPGTYTLTVEYQTYERNNGWQNNQDIITITVTEAEAEPAMIFYLKSPTSDPISNETDQWGNTIGNGTVKTNGATWVEYKNIFSPGQYVISMAEGMVKQADGSWLLPNDGRYTEHYQAIFEAYQSELEEQLGVRLDSVEDIKAIYLTPYKISKNNYTNPDKHIDCTISVKTQEFFTAKFWVTLPDGTQNLVEAKNYREGSNVAKTTLAPADGTYPETMTMNGITYRFDGWYNEANQRVDDANWPYEPNETELKNGTVEFYARYVQSGANLTVQKTVSGNMYDANKKFAFTVTVDGVETEFNLGKDETKTITVPVNAAVTVTENPDGYTYSFVSITEGVTKENTTYGVSFTMPAKDVTVVINNDKTVKVDTGVSLETLPYILILGVVAVGVVLMVRRRRHGYDD